MNDFISRFKYRLLSVFVLSVVIFALLFIVVPKATVVADSLALVRSQLKISESLQGEVGSPDSLIAEYRKISVQIKKQTSLQVTSSKILTFVYGTAEKNNVLLQDLSTGEIVRGDGRREIPVSFKAKSGFADFHNFLTDVENGDFCVGVSDISMNREENGSISAAIRLSVVSKEFGNE